MHKRTIGNIALVMAISVVSCLPAASSETEKICFVYGKKNCQAKILFGGFLSSKDYCHNTCKKYGDCCFGIDSDDTCPWSVRWGKGGTCQNLEK